MNAPRVFTARVKRCPITNTTNPRIGPRYGTEPLTISAMRFTANASAVVARPRASKREYDKMSEKYPILLYPLHSHN